MKRKITLLLLAASSVLTMSSQVVFQEGFTDPFNPATTGWVVENLSQPMGSTTWTQGTNNYNSYNGGPTDYYFANFNSTGTVSPAGISNWLITPTLTIFNGAVLKFATKTIDQGNGVNFAADRLQVRLAPNGSTVIPTGTTSVGSFSLLLLDINPNLNTNTTSAVSNGSVDGYPNTWTVYTVQVTGAPTGTSAGRFAFRYFVDDAGFGGTNSNNVGIDDVEYILPCGATVQSFTTCANQPVVLTAQGGVSSTNYVWSNSANSSTYTTASINVNSGNSTTVYSLSTSNAGVSCGAPITATITVSGNTAIVTATSSAGNSPICDGDVVTLSAQDAANTYTWLTGTVPSVTVVSTSASFTDAPGVTTTYTVGYVGPNNTCPGSAVVTVSVNAVPTLSIDISPQIVCGGQTVTLTTSGASTYTYNLSGSIYTNNPLPLALNNVTAVVNGGFVVAGTGTNGCISGGTVALTVNPSPSITITNPTGAATFTVCRGTTPTFTANGADSYSWTGTNLAAPGSTDNPLTYSVGTSTGNRTLTVVGTSVEGCTATASFVMQTSQCVGIETIPGSAEANIFPNPFTNELKLTGLNGSIEIYNALGQVVVKANVKNDSEVINTTDLTKGIYIIKTYNTAGSLTKTVKLVKN